MHVEDLMNRDVVTVSPATPLKEVANLLVEHGISGVPVCSEGRVLGVVSESDIVWKELRSIPGEGGMIARLLDRAYGDDDRAKATTAGEAMSSPAITIGPDVAVAAAARLMIEYMINRLPVVQAGRLVGIFTRSDVVRAFRRTDEEIAHDIQDELRELWIDPQRVSVRVTLGEVVVTGEVENHSYASSIERRIRRLPGVVNVRSELRWVIDDSSHKTAIAAERLGRKV